jgi:hypothetical protein
MAKDWKQHAAPYLREGMRSALAKAKKTWKGKKSMTAAQMKRIKKLQDQRDRVNKAIKKIRET